MRNPIEPFATGCHWQAPVRPSGTASERSPATAFEEERRKKKKRPWGSAQVIDNARFGEGNPRKSKDFPLINFGRALLDEARIWLNFDLVWKNTDLIHTF
jgi:hypothetical protein